MSADNTRALLRAAEHRAFLTDSVAELFDVSTDEVEVRAWWADNSIDAVVCGDLVRVEVQP